MDVIAGVASGDPIAVSLSGVAYSDMDQAVLVPW